jgi:hypothetical protein
MMGAPPTAVNECKDHVASDLRGLAEIGQPKVTVPPYQVLYQPAWSDQQVRPVDG